MFAARLMTLGRNFRQLFAFIFFGVWVELTTQKVISALIFVLTKLGFDTVSFPHHRPRYWWARTLICGFKSSTIIIFARHFKFAKSFVFSRIPILRALRKDWTFEEIARSWPSLVTNINTNLQLNTIEDPVDISLEEQLTQPKSCDDCVIAINWSWDWPG